MSSGNTLWKVSYIISLVSYVATEYIMESQLLQTECFILYHSVHITLYVSSRNISLKTDVYYYRQVTELYGYFFHVHAFGHTEMA